jgi:hypothetical protein
MPFRKEWTPAPPALTLEVLAAQGCPSYFLHNNSIYLGFLAPAPMPEVRDLWYVAIAYHAATPTKFLGSTVVTPVTRARVPFL